MIKFNNKRDVDRHVSQMSQKLNENERSSRGFAIAKSYAKVNEYDLAKDWLQRYLELKTDDAAAHKFMGEICERLHKPEQAITHFQRSYTLNSKQNDIIKNVCRLFLLDDGWSASPAKAKYWCELAEMENIRDDNVFNLRLKMANKDKKQDTKPVEDMILREITARPQDVGLRIRLLKFLIEEKRLNDAFKYCFDIEMKCMEIFLSSIDWYTTVSSVLTQNVLDTWNYWCLLLITLEKQIYLTLKKDLSLQAIKQNNIKEVANLIFGFDQVLKKANDALLSLAPAKEFTDEFINHFRGNMALHIASLLFQKQKIANNDQWYETTKKCLPFLVFAFQCSIVSTEAFWLKNTNDTIRNLFAHLKKEGAFRCAQAARTILSCKAKLNDDVVQISCNKYWFSIDDIFNQVREICSDLNWRKNIYRLLFANADQQVKISTSYFVQNSFFQEPCYEKVSFNDVENYEQIAQHLYPSSLDHHVYLGLGRTDLHTYTAETFNGLNLSTSNLINCNPETINRIDIDSFLYCAIIQAKRRLEAEKASYESFNNRPNERPLFLPASNIIEGLCTEEQNDWWLSAFKIYKNISGDNMAQLKATLQFGIEAIRGIDTPKIDLLILLKLGDVLHTRSNLCSKIDEKRHLDIRVEYIYKFAVKMMRNRDMDGMRRLFKFSTNNYDVEHDIDHYAAIAIGYLSGVYFKREEYKEFIDDFTGVKNAWAYFFRAEAYRKLDESAKTPKKTKKLYTEKARESLIETLSLLDTNDHFDKNNPLRIRVEKDLKKLQYDLSSSFNNDELEFHNASASQNGFGDDEIFHNASSSSLRARRDISFVSAATALPNYTEKFGEVEGLIRKLNDLVISVKDDVLCVRNDITSLKEDILNIRGDITDLNVNKDATTSKALNDIYKSIEDLTWNMSCMMNIFPNAAAGSVMPQQQRFQPSPANQIPSQSQFNQMYNTAYPIYPMQCPVSRPSLPGQLPSHIQYADQMGVNLLLNPSNYNAPIIPSPHTPQQPSLNNGGQPKSSLLEALNTPTVLNTWNNAYPLMPTIPSTIPQMASSSQNVASSMQLPQQMQQTIQTTIQNKPIEKAPPINVVITSSDPLPTQNTITMQPTLSVTIPPQHIKHTTPIQQQQSVITSTSVVNSSQYEDISPTKHETSEYYEESADYDPRPDFKPIIPLPAEIEVKTGEENEQVLFEERAKLFRFVEKEWKERGIGNIKILKNLDTKKCRIVMRREQIHKLCANHVITPEMDLKKTQNEQSLMWGANDYSEEEMKLEKFLVRFKHVDHAKKFKEMFELAKKLATESSESIKETPKDDTLKTHTNTAKIPTQKDQTLKSTVQFGGTLNYSFGGFTGNLATPENKIISKGKESASKPAQQSPFANFTFGGSSNKSFTELFSSLNSSKPESSSTPVQKTPDLNTSATQNIQNEDDAEHFEPTAHFEPVIPLPDLIENKTGEEDENVVFTHRAKLLRFDANVKEWKERGIGEMKVLLSKNDPTKARLLMRREQVLKLCCNMPITKELKFVKMGSNAVSFGGQDFSDGEMKTEKLALKFKTPELIRNFQDAVLDIQKKMTEKPTPELQNKATENEKKKEEVQGFGDKFKPKAGSWSCKACYISNKPETLYCVACESPKDDTVPKKETKSLLAPAADAPKFSFGVPAAKPIEKKDVSEKKDSETQGFGNKFKPQAGSWNCEACYISNKPDTLYCVACESPKDSTVPKKESKSILTPASDAPKFSFGMPNATGFSFGMPTTTVAPSVTTTTEQQKPQSTTGFLFGTSVAPSITSSFSFGNKSSSSEVSSTTNESIGGFKFATSPKSFSFDKNSVSTDASASTESKIELNPSVQELGKTDSGFNFVFKKKSPAKTKSPAKSRNDSVNSEGGDEAGDNEYHEEEENQTYFTPVIPLPDKIDVKTGEEDETALYSHRAKLFRFTDNEWKERGLGDIKILKHNETGKLRMVMRREQVHKICLNFFLTDEIEFKRKDDQSWTFGAVDFSEGEFEARSFAIRFKNKEICESFKKAIDDALKGINDSVAKASANEQDSKSKPDDFMKLTKQLMLPENFFDYEKAPDCLGCIGCKSDEYVYDQNRKPEYIEDKSPLPLMSPSNIVRNKTRRASQDKKVSFKIAEKKENENVSQLFEGKIDKSMNETSKNDIFGLQKSEVSMNIFAKFNQENPVTTQSNTTTTSIFGSNSQNIFGDNKNIFGNSSASTNSTTSIFSSSLNTGTIPQASQSDSSKTAEQTTSIFGTKTNFGSILNGTNIFGGANKENKPTFGSAFSNTPVFGANIFGSAQNNVSKTSENSSLPERDIFSSASSFSFAEAAKELDKSKETSITATSSSTNEPEFLKNVSKMGGFAELAATSSSTEAFNTKQSTTPGQFFGLVVKDDFFSKNLNKQNTSTDDTSHNDNDHVQDDNYDPHYDPIISLPDEIKVSTGEEDEEKLFGERAKLYRYDTKTKEWKERGVGELKVLHHPKNKTYRLIMRREQIFKLVLNQLITADIHMSPMENSTKAFCWAGMNYAEVNNGEAEQLAIRFKNEELANNFKKLVDECQSKLESSEE